MFDYLQQFNNLPKDLRDKVSSSEVMSAIFALEKKYKVELAAFVMKVMVKKYSASKLAFYLMSDFKINSDMAKNLETELLEKVFFKVKDYLKIDEKSNEIKKEERKEDKKESQQEIEKKSLIENNKAPEDQHDFNQDKPKVLEKISLADKMSQPVTPAISNKDMPENNKDKSQELEANEEVKDKNETSFQKAELKTVDTKESDSSSSKSEIDKNLNSSEKSLSVDEQAKDAISKSAITLSSSYLSNRLFLVVKTYIKGVRDIIATRSVLARGVSEGGLGLDKASIDKLLKNIKELKAEENKNYSASKPPVSVSLEKKQLEDRLKNLDDNYSLKKSLESQGKVVSKEHNLQPNQEEKIEAPKEEIIKETLKISPPHPSIIEPQASQAIKENVKLESETKKTEEASLAPENLPVAKPVENLAKEAKPSSKPVESKTAEPEVEEFKKTLADSDTIKQPDKKNIFDFSKKDKETVKSSDIKTPAESKTKEDQPTQVNEQKSFEPQTATNKFQPKLNPNKPRLDDIRMVNKVMGPVDEIASIDIVDFRRLGKTPEDSILKIKEKLNLLEKSSYEKMIAGIEAWRQNPLNQLYRDISIESINQGRPVPEIIKDREDQGKDFLSVEEFKALINFNREITF
ncbi:MAG: hypothetical protein K9M44_02045 [Candidatus Pacebacteria bacterium]|nr:hypothetical protein [Candidatus Paceibacterota bacterium]